MKFSSIVIATGYLNMALDEKKKSSSLVQY